MRTDTGVHDILGEIHDLWQELDHLQQLHACLGRHLVVLKNPPMDMRKTLVQLARQEPVGTRLLREAEAAIQGLKQEVIEVNKNRARRCRVSWKFARTLRMWNPWRCPPTASGVPRVRRIRL